MEIEWPRHHRQTTLSCAWPLLGRKIPVKLNSVIIRIAQVKRVANAVVGCAFQRKPRLNQSLQGIRQFRPGRIQNRKMIKARRPRCRRLAAKALPGIQADVMVIPAAAERRLNCRCAA